ncbi:FadR/GntR family transcriptional regulator [Paracoccus pacificus]|uniref:FadR/GntR family transcriptional regulator n=1 Tax=Paracoccus pacificus TaxID=1463598 RepID=A0ABW4RE96_9RHOB
MGSKFDNEPEPAPAADRVLSAEGMALLRGANLSSNVFEATVERIGKSIKLGLLKPGQQLPPERELAELMGVSRVTVRSAIQVLTAGGFLMARRGRNGGTFVVEKPPVWKGGGAGAGSGPVAVSGFLDRRFVLETGICELAAIRATDTQVGSLRERVGRLGELIGDLTAFRREDAQFHIAIAEATGNQDLVRHAAELQAELSDLIGQLPPSEDALIHSNLQHAKVVACIACHDGAGARQAMAEHLAGTGHFLSGLLPFSGDFQG